MAKINWYPMPLEQESHRVSGIMDTFYEYALKKDMTKELFQEIRLRAISRQNLIMSGFGTQGSGKSWKYIFIAEKTANFLEYELNADKNVFFTITDLNRELENLEKGAIYILDEQVKTHGLGSKIERDWLDNIEMTVRADKLYFFFLCPAFIRHNFMYFTESWEKGRLKSHGTWDWNKPVESQWEYTKSIVNDNKLQKLGYIITGTPEDKKFLLRYEERKAKFLEDVRRRKIGKRPLYIMEIADKLIKDEEFVLKWGFLKAKDDKLLFVTGEYEVLDLGVREQGILVGRINYLLNVKPKVDKALAKLRKQSKE